jgi:hypothetical protein
MKKLLSLSAIAFSLSIGLTGLAQAQSAAPASAPAAVKTAQQSKMVTCNGDAQGKKGDERKAFMKECLSAKKEAAPAAASAASAAAASTASAASPQQNKMKTCNVEAQGKKGDERKSFMKECLSK